MLPKVVFIDEVTPLPYGPNIRSAGGCGGTEITVVMLAEALSSTGLFEVTVEQHNRADKETGAASYAPCGAAQEADYVICLRDPRTLRKARERFPKAKLYLYSHDLASPALFSDPQMFKDVGLAANLVVSNFHRSQTGEVMRQIDYPDRFYCKVVYNPIDDDLKPDGTAYDPNKLCFISSPHKGLDYALSLFGDLRKLNPKFEFHVTNPGYFKGNHTQQDGVVFHGALAYSEVLSVLRSSLCLFFPNTTFPETFGRVITESDAVGTPVLTHMFGAAQEVMDHPHEVMDCRNRSKVIERVMDWHRGARPTVRGRNSFRMRHVLKTWIKEILV